MNQVPVESLKRRWGNPFSRLYPWNPHNEPPIHRDEITQALRDPALDEPGPWSVSCHTWNGEYAHRKNHIYRIAWFVKHREASQPILVSKKYGIEDGWHRYIAAVYCGDQFISAI